MSLDFASDFFCFLNVLASNDNLIFNIEMEGLDIEDEELTDIPGGLLTLY